MTPETFTRLWAWIVRGSIALTVAAFLVFACGGCEQSTRPLRDDAGRRNGAGYAGVFERAAKLPGAGEGYEERGFGECRQS